MIETMLRLPEVRIFPESEFASRSLATLVTTKQLRLVLMMDEGLKKLGTTATSATGKYSVSGTWADAIFDHPDMPDGILYRSSRDNSQVCAAIFSRASAVWNINSSVGLLSLGRQLDAVLTRYDCGIDPGV